MLNTFNCDEAKKLLNAGGQLIDVRSPLEFSSVHLDGAMNLPLQSLARELNRLDNGKPVLVYCASGQRSSMAAQILESAGFRQVYNLGPLSNFLHCH